MPARSMAQLRLMRAVAHDPGFARKAGISQDVGREFEQATPAGARLPERKTTKRRALRRGV